MMDWLRQVLGPIVPNMPPRNMLIFLGIVAVVALIFVYTWAFHKDEETEEKATANDNLYRYSEIHEIDPGNEEAPDPHIVSLLFLLMALEILTAPFQWIWLKAFPSWKSPH